MAINQTDFDAIKRHAQQLEEADATRNTLFDQLDNMYLLKPSDLPEADWIKQTISPDARNAVNGAVRLLIGSDPIFSVPRETNPSSMRKVADKIERAAKGIWDQAGMTAQRPVHYDIAHSGVHYSEIHIMLESAKGIADLQPPGGAKEHALRQARRSPVLFTVVNPRDGHPEWGPMGLSAYYSKRQLRISEIKQRFGKIVDTQKKETDLIDVHDYWSLDWHIIWSDDQAIPYVAEPNQDGFIPVVAVICEGSFLFNQEGQDTRQGFLYTALKSNLWSRKNLYLTVMNSLVFAIGANPLLVFESTDEGGLMEINYDQPGGVIKIKPGEKLYALLQKVIDPQLVEQMTIIDRLMEESTMYKTATGQPLGANAPFSMVSLLSQAGRLPLVVYQRMISMAVTLAIRAAFHIIKRDGMTVRASGKTGLQEIEAGDIPDDFDIRASMEIALPQDDRLNVQIATQGIQAKLFSKRYGRETYAKIGQSQDMDDEILEEAFADMQAQAELQKAIQQLQAEMMQQQQPPQGMPPPQPGPGGMPGQMPPGMPPEMGGQPMPMGEPGMQGGEGLPMMAPGEPMGSPFGPGGEMPMEGMEEMA